MQAAEQRDQLLREGFVLLPGMVDGDELQSVRQSVDAIVDRAPTRGRVTLTEWVDASTAAAVEFMVDDRLFQSSRKLMEAENLACLGMWSLCQAGTGWHRDIHPYDMAPLDGLQEDIHHNGPPYLQWNVALYDDDYFHVIPRSHTRRNTEKERGIERRDGPVELPGMTCLDLKAGDGAVCINNLLHCAKPSGARKRRTLHLGFEGFGIRNFVHFNRADTLGTVFTKHLAPWAAERFEKSERLYDGRQQQVEKLFRAILDRDRDLFSERLAGLHTSPHARMTTLVVLSKLAQGLLDYSCNSITDRPRGWRTDQMASRFTAAERHALWDCFRTLDEKLQAEEELYESLFQSAPTKYYFNEMPVGFEVDDFIASWPAHPT